MKKIKLKKRKNRLRFKKKLVLTSTLVLLFVIGIGYSLLSVNLNILGNITVKKVYGNTLYEVLEKESDIGTYAREYNKGHHDSFTQEPTKKIYHWYAPDTSAGDTLATEIQNKNNVIFANHCWQMFRTTDTGGVKLIYNGEVENNQCLNTRGTHVGYDSRSRQTLSTSYYYGTSYTYDKTNNVFSLSGTVTTGTIQSGQYTCMQTTSTGTCATLYLIDTLYNENSYYVISLNGNSHYSQIGNIPFNPSLGSIAYAGYMYNNVYISKSLNPSDIEVLMYDWMNSSSNYYYGTGVTYDTSTHKYTLTETTRGTWTNTYSSAGGLYTCKSTADTTCSSVYYIVAGVSTGMYGFYMTDGNLLNYYNTNIVLGTGYTESNGTYTLTGTMTTTKENWYSNYETYKDYYTCGNNSTTCTDMRYLTNTYRYHYYCVFLSNNYIYANDFTYNSGTGKYTLGSDRFQTWNVTDSDKANMATHHYTCFNDTGECTTISYVFAASKPDYISYIRYIDITGGKSVEDALSEMLSSDDINQTSSTIKIGIDAWYKKYLTSYTSKLEDTVFCNDRSIVGGLGIGAWNPNGGTISSALLLGKNSYLTCSNETDKFSTINNKARLTYPIGLLTNPEAELLNNNNILKTNQTYWLNSPDHFSGSISHHFVAENGAISYGNSNSHGVRPVISLKPGAEYVSGDGSMANPYVVSTS